MGVSYQPEDKNTIKILDLMESLTAEVHLNRLIMFEMGRRLGIEDPEEIFEDMQRRFETAEKLKEG